MPRMATAKKPRRRRADAYTTAREAVFELYVSRLREVQDREQAAVVHRAIQIALKAIDAMAPGASSEHTRLAIDAMHTALEGTTVDDASGEVERAAGAVEQAAAAGAPFGGYVRRLLVHLGDVMPEQKAALDKIAIDKTQSDRVVDLLRRYRAARPNTRKGELTARGVLTEILKLAGVRGKTTHVRATLARHTRSRS